MPSWNAHWHIFLKHSMTDRKKKKTLLNERKLQRFLNAGWHDTITIFWKMTKTRSTSSSRTPIYKGRMDPNIFKCPTDCVTSITIRKTSETIPSGEKSTNALSNAPSLSNGTSIKGRAPLGHQIIWLFVMWSLRWIIFSDLQKVIRHLATSSTLACKQVYNF